MMNKLRANYIYHLVGVINKRTKYEIRKGEQKGQFYWRLDSIIENKPEIKSVKIYANSLENKAIWDAVENKEWFGKRYDLQCRNSRGNYYLINWKELGQSSSEKADDYGSN